MGHQHIRDGMLSVTQEKTGVRLAIPVHSDLRVILDATPSEHLTFLTMTSGKPYGGEQPDGQEAEARLRISEDTLRGYHNEWSDDDYDVLADGAVVGRIFKANTAPVGSAWMWTLAFGNHEDRMPTHGYVPTSPTRLRL
jgi:hypothetical protein